MGLCTSNHEFKVMWCCLHRLSRGAELFVFRREVNSNAGLPHFHPHPPPPNTHTYFRYGDTNQISDSKEMNRTKESKIRTKEKTTQKGETLQTVSPSTVWAVCNVSHLLPEAKDVAENRQWCRARNSKPLESLTPSPAEKKSVPSILKIIRNRGGCQCSIITAEAQPVVTT